jgi:glycosyltransferase involved in cell wall biosynthesis
MLTALSLVVTTLGRTDQLAILLRSLDGQDMKAFELIIVDQNDDDRLNGIISSGSWSFPIVHLRRPGMRGASRGRNEGWRQARGTYVLFPDDDCWYPPHFLSRGLEIATRANADFVAGRPVDETGRTINGRYSKAAHEITRQNVWVSGIEWLIFVRRACLQPLGGFDERIGVGAQTPWQSSEAPDFMFRALEKGMRGFYDPELYGHHPEMNVYTPDEATIRKGRAYARGMGFVLRKAGYGPVSAIYWVMRAVANMALALTRGNIPQFRYYSNWAVGRLEGYLERALPL